MNTLDISTDKDNLTQAARNFRNQYYGKTASLSAKQLAVAIRDYEQLTELMGKLSSYAFLNYASDTLNETNQLFYQQTEEFLTDIGSHTLFLTAEIVRIDEARLQEYVEQEPCLAYYRPWLDNICLFREHRLSDDLERLMNEKSVSASGSWVRLFDETVASLRVPMNGRDLTCAEVINLFSSPDQVVRKEAATAFGAALKDNSRVFTHITNILIKDKEINDKWCKYPHSLSARNLGNMIEDHVVDCLVQAVKANYPNISHRYYSLKAKLLNVQYLNYWDRNAPVVQHEERCIPWHEAVSVVLSAYQDFSPLLAELGGKFFSNNWIDAELRPGKESGAFAHPVVPSIHPYLLLNYQGKIHDVMTLAHELGHGVHQMLAAKNGPLMSNTPITLAETASVFGEKLVFKKLLSTIESKAEHIAVLSQKIEDMLNTVIRQISFLEFEKQLHITRRSSTELTTANIGDIWMKSQQDSLGPVFKFSDDYNYYWMYIPHFIHSPFYVYGYAFGDCLVNALYKKYENNPDGFVDKYIDMLASGGARKYSELLAAFDMDATKADFWQNGLDVITDMINELESLM
jgi:oligoendopeptidase F